MPAPVLAIDPGLLDEYLREPRSIRRAVSRDLAREHPVAPKRPQYGAVARWLSAPRPKPVRSPQLRLTPTSGQHRVNAKRNERAVYWAAFEVDRLLNAEA